jgi:Protein of Unknown function (DUF2784)
VLYRVLADVTMVVHFAFVVYVVVGGFLAWRWPRTIVAHALAASWGLLITAMSLRCPLTPVEDTFRRKAGGEGLPGGFVDNYIEGVLYPERYVDHVRVLLVLVVLLSWIGFVVRLRRRRASTARAEAST